MSGNKKNQDLEKEYQASLPHLFAVTQLLEEKLEGKTYLIGDSPTIADIQLGTEVLNHLILGLSYESYPNISRWRKKLVMGTPGFREVHKEFIE